MTNRDQLNQDAAQPADVGRCSRSQIPPYAMACLQGAPDPAEWAGLQRHLEGCAACRAELDDLLALLADTGEPLVGVDSEPPIFDLTLLPPWQGLAAAGQPPQGMPLVLHMLDITRTLVIDLGLALGTAAPGPSLAGAFRAGGSGDEFHQTIHIDQPDELDMAIDLVRVDPQSDLYRLRVTVIEASDPFAQSGHRVILQYETQSREALTDERGSVVFTDVPFAALSQIQLTVRLRRTGES